MLANIKQDNKEAKIYCKRYGQSKVEMLLNKNIIFHIEYTKVYESFKIFKAGSLSDPNV